MHEVSPDADDNGSPRMRRRRLAWQWPVAIRDFVIHTTLFAIVLRSGIEFVGLMVLLLIQTTLLSGLVFFDRRQTGTLRKLGNVLGGLALGAFVVGMTAAFLNLTEGTAQGVELLGFRPLLELDLSLLAWTLAWVFVLILTVLLYVGWCRPPRPSAFHLIVQQAALSFFAMLIMMFLVAILFAVQDIMLRPLRFLWFFFPGLGFEDFLALILVLVRLALSLVLSHAPGFERPSSNAAATADRAP